MSMKSKIIDGLLGKIEAELSKVIIGQKEVIKLLAITVLSGGHSLIQGVPGLAKTLLVNAFARAMSLSFSRIQFTPDLVPSDITGTEIIDFSGKKQGFTFLKGPIFANIILADEINRTPPKTQAALLEAMQEKKVTILGKTYELPLPFFVFATQNPIEYQGTYPLPEAQLDRFLFRIDMDYPDYNEEMLILDVDPSDIEKVDRVLTVDEIFDYQTKVRNIFVSTKVKEYVLALCRNSRPEKSDFSFVREYVKWGIGPRGSQMLLVASKANALIKGKDFVDKEDVDEVVFPVFRHRFILNYHALAEGISTDDLIKLLISEVEKRI